MLPYQANSDAAFPAPALPTLAVEPAFPLAAGDIGPLFCPSVLSFFPVFLFHFRRARFPPRFFFWSRPACNFMRSIADRFRYGLRSCLGLFCGSCCWFWNRRYCWRWRRQFDFAVRWDDMALLLRFVVF